MGPGTEEKIVPHLRPEPLYLRLGKGRGVSKGTRRSHEYGSPKNQTNEENASTKKE